MSSNYLHPAILLYMDRLADWSSYFTYAKGDGVDIESERQALMGVLETTANICSEVEESCRETWEEPATLVDGNVILPAATQKAYDLLKESGIVSLNVKEKYGGFGLGHFGRNISSCVRPGCTT